MSLPDITIQNNVLDKRMTRVGDHVVIVQNLDNRIHRISGKSGSVQRVEPGMRAQVDLRK